MVQKAVDMGDSEREPTPGLAIDIRKVSCLYGAMRAVDDLSITIPAGEFVSLLGPSGSGKTTLLMAIAGFQNIASGSICIGGKDISHSPPHKRDLGVVFQRYALFPHMNVTENIEYALRMRGVPSKRREKVTKNTLELVGLQELRDRRPAQLSGGQQQRVALARVLVYEPQVILFDEPLSALDRKLRQQVQLELRRLNKESGITMLFVTHDQEEALIMSDKVALLRDGKIEQYGTGRELYHRPVTEFAAGFLGRTNLLDATIVNIEGKNAQVLLGGVLFSAIGNNVHNPAKVGSTCRVAVRPENVIVTPPQANNGLQCTVKEVVFTGATTYITGDVDGQEILAQGLSSSPDLDVEPGSIVSLQMSSGGLALL